jgi:hypothetical protein
MASAATMKKPSKSVSTSIPTPKSPAKAATQAKARRPAKSRASGPRPAKLLAGGNPQIAKADGDAPVQAYVAALPGWKGDVGRKLDALIVRTVPNVQKAVKWNSPFYRAPNGEGWFLAFHAFTHYIKVNFFRGALLKPLPPGPSKNDEVRYVDIREGEFDEAQMAKWVKQAARLPGWVP